MNSSKSPRFSMPLPLRLDEWSKVDDAESWRDPILIPCGGQPPMVRKKLPTRPHKVLGERKEEGERRLACPPGLQNSHFRRGVAVLVHIGGPLYICVKSQAGQFCPDAAFNSRGTPEDYGSAYDYAKNRLRLITDCPHTRRCENIK